MFSTILTIGQMVFAIGGTANNYPLMLTGRFIFGLGGECMSVSQSAIVANWFKGNELSFAFGLNLSVSRAGSVLNGVVTPRLVADHDGLIGFALWVGFGFCCFSTLNAFALAIVDYWADKKDNTLAVKLSEEDKFKWKDLTTFGLPYWLITVSCCMFYMSTSVYFMLAEGLCEKKFGFTAVNAGSLAVVPYFMSMGLSPILGFTIDKVGRRAMFIMISSIISVVACVYTAFMKTLPPDSPNPDYFVLIPLIGLGFAYSIYASALWGSIPYVV
jgi:MFS family permease